MKQFTLKFTEENLKRHLDYNKNLIFTIRDEPKGGQGDVTIIDGVIYELILIGYITMKGTWNTFWKSEGFSSKEEYETEIHRIYGDDSTKKLYIHVLNILPSVGE
ncbi:MAG: hypothetical protein PHT24_06665 [Endomicrobiaceae bacterium]|nr:hypothetical protein [Endomicrobiaceae bacterium]